VAPGRERRVAVTRTQSANRPRYVATPPSFTPTWVTTTQSTPSLSPRPKPSVSGLRSGRRPAVRSRRRKEMETMSS